MLTPDLNAFLDELEKIPSVVLRQEDIEPRTDPGEIDKVACPHLEKLAEIPLPGTGKTHKKELTQTERNLMKIPLLGAGVAGGYGASMLTIDALRKDRGLRQAWKRMTPKGKMRAFQLATAAAGVGTLAGGALRARLREDEVRKDMKSAR